MVHLPISLTVAVVALNIVASVAAPVVQDGELDARTLEILEPRKKNRSKKNLPITTPNPPQPPTVPSEKVEATPPGKKGAGHYANQILDKLESHPETLRAGTDVLSSYVGSRVSSNSGGADPALQGRAGAPDPLPTNPAEGQNQGLPPSLVVALFITKKVFFGGIDPPIVKSVKAKAQTDKDMGFKQSITDTESPPQGPASTGEVSKRNEAELYPRFTDVLGEVH